MVTADDPCEYYTCTSTEWPRAGPPVNGSPQRLTAAQPECLTSPQVLDRSYRPPGLMGGERTASYVTITGHILVPHVGDAAADSERVRASFF